MRSGIVASFHYLQFPKKDSCMKSILTTFFLAFALCISAQAQFVTIPDANFVTYLQTNFPTCMSGNQMDTTCSALIAFQNMDVSNKGIADLTGIQYFDDLI